MTILNATDFYDRSVIITTHDDRRLASLSSAPFRHEQSSDGPLYIAIRKNATDEALRYASTRFGIALRTLDEFREQHAK